MANENPSRQQSADQGLSGGQMGSGSGTSAASHRGGEQRGQAQAGQWQSGQSQESGRGAESASRDPRTSAGYGSAGGAGTSAGSYGRSGSGQGPRAYPSGGNVSGSREQSWTSRGALQPRSSTSATPWSGSTGYGFGPFSAMQRISEEMDRIFETFGIGRGTLPSEGTASGRMGQGFSDDSANLWSPHIEVCERNGKLLIQADLPGVRREDVHVQVEDDAVVIQGQRKQDNERQERGYYHSERSYGSFYRMISLPEGLDPESAHATFHDGVLEVEVALPRQGARGRRLEIQEGRSSSTGSSGTGGAQGSYGTGQGSSGTQGTYGGTHGTGAHGSAGTSSASGRGASGSTGTTGTGASSGYATQGTSGATSTAGSHGTTDSQSSGSTATHGASSYGPPGATGAQQGSGSSQPSPSGPAGTSGGSTQERR